MYYKSISTCLLLVAILFGCALANAEVRATSSVSLHMFGSSSIWWVAVQPRNDNGKTAKVELKDKAMSSYVALSYNKDWGYYSVSSSSGTGFSVPLSFRLTSSSGEVITATVNTIVADTVIDTGASFGASSTATSAPTTAPTTKPTTAPAATAAPTTKPTTAPAATAAPTTKPTTAPTTRPTSAPTTAPTTKPTSAATTAPTTDLCTVTSTSSEPLKILVPLYVYPGAAWDTLIAAASKVKIIAIINPSSGPLSTVDSSYSTYMTKLKNAGIEMVGYVYTGYGTRALSAVQADIDLYASKYPLVTGIFLDEAASDSSKLTFYTTVYNYIMAKSGYVHSILNPGVQPDQGYLDISTNVVIYENYASSLASTSYSSWVTCAPSSAKKAGYKYKFSGIVHTASSSDQASIISSLATKGMGLVYVTDGAGGCCTYNTLTSYFAAEATSVAALN